MKKNLVIFGSSGHAYEIYQSIDKKKYNFLGFVEKKLKKSCKKIYCYENEPLKLSKKNIFGIVGIYDITIRKKVVEKILSINPNFKFISIISNKSLISKNSNIGKNTFIANGVIVNSNSEIKDHTVLNTGSIVEHDCIIGNFVNISPNCTILGHSIILDEVYVGAGTVIKQHIKINKKNVIGANAFVNKSINQKNQKYLGNPAKKYYEKN
jgi:sugar O-acyltransferase (sialic acid O-acetyltransferase NeuD family)